MTNLTQVGRTLGITSLTLGAAAGLVSMGALAAFWRSLPRLDGTLRLPGLGERVDVLRDRWGVPHIYAANNHDLFMTLGYVHAQDRLWQMELNRCTGQGRLAEIFGAPVLDTDRFARVIGFGRLARRDVAQMDADTRELVERYVQGINHFIESHSNRLPPEFAIMRHHPTPWTADDVLAWSKAMGYGLSLNWVYELLNARLVEAVGAQQAQALLLHYPTSHPVTVSENVLARVGIGEEVPHRQGNTPTNGNGTRRSLSGMHDQTGQGSNAWVVHGQRSSSGLPLLANDPHLKASLPAIWYEAHLHGGDYAVTGATFPGLPGVLIGHNTHIAWGITNAMVDVQDLYHEQFHPDNPLLYAWQGGWEQAELVREEMSVRGQAEPFVEEVRMTRHGPIVSSVLEPLGSSLPVGQEDAAAEYAPADAPTAEADAAHECLALRWTGFEANNVVWAALALNRARNWHEFRAALAAWDTPPQNFVYADVEGHYGYALAGKLPIRARGNGRLPVPGWDGDYEWTGYIPPDALPAAYDPPEGLAVSANNKITDQHHPYDAHIYGEWMNGYRAARIRELIEATPRHDVQSFARMHADQYSLPGRELARLMADVPLSDPLEVQARDVLVAWDGHLTPDSIGGTIYATLRYHLEQQAYAAMGDLRSGPVGVGLFQVLPGSEGLSRRALPGILARITAAQGAERADPWLGEGQTWNAILQECMRLTVAELSEHYGADPKHWKYGRTRLLGLRHVLGRFPMLAPIFNRGHWPLGGDLDTLCMSHRLRSAPESSSYVVPLYRQICDTSDWDASVSVLIGGQSGHPASRHYTDMTSLWLRGEYHPMLWSRARVEEHCAATLVLEPET